MTPRQILDKAKATQSILADQIAQRSQHLTETQSRIEAFEKAQALIQEVATETQEALKFHLTALVQEALDAIFPGTYIFRVTFEIARGKTAVSFALEKDGMVLENLLDEVGGTLIDLVAVALRVAVWTLRRTDTTILLDEAGKHISSQYRPIFWEMLSGLSKELGIQFIAVTHDPIAGEYADRTFEVSQGADGRSKIKVTEGVGA